VSSVNCKALVMEVEESYYYFRQVNGVNVGDTVFIRCVSACMCVCAQWTGQSDQFKMLKANGGLWYLGP